jgi:hypothetical protein
MPQTGDERYCGTHTRCYFDQQWDVIYTEDDQFYWRDKVNHVTYDCNSSQNGTALPDEPGKVVKLFDDEEEDARWEEAACDEIYLPFLPNFPLDTLPKSV